MSRIGKKPVVVPKGVVVTLQESEGRTTIIAKKANLSLSRLLPAGVSVSVTATEVVVNPPSSSELKGLYGLTRTLVANMLEGLDKGFEKKMEINGVGYRAQVKGKFLGLTLGFSHPIDFPIPTGVEVKVDQNTKLTISSHDKELLGQTCAKIRAYRPPEPYQGKGIKYVDEVILRKEGKSAGK